MHSIANNFYSKKIATLKAYEANGGFVFTRDFSFALRSKNFVFVSRKHVFPRGDLKIDTSRLKAGAVRCELYEGLFLVPTLAFLRAVTRTHPGIPAVHVDVTEDETVVSYTLPGLNVNTIVDDSEYWRINYVGVGIDNYQHGIVSRTYNGESVKEKSFSGVVKTTKEYFPDAILTKVRTGMETVMEIQRDSVMRQLVFFDGYGSIKVNIFDEEGRLSAFIELSDDSPDQLFTGVGYLYTDPEVFPFDVEDVDFHTDTVFDIFFPDGRVISVGPNF